jgi:hypothetical protein
MPTRLVRLTVHDGPVLIALDGLRTARKQSAFVVDALRHYLATEAGQAQLESYLGAAPEEPNSRRRPERGGKGEQPVPPSGSKNNLDDIFR